MFGIDRRLVQNFDWTLFLLVASIVGIGIFNLASATHIDDELTGEVRRQLISLGLGVVALLVAVAVDYRHFERLAMPAFGVCVALLAATLVFAPVTRGSQSWLFGGRLQPSELAKLGLILALARYFCRNPPGEIRRQEDEGALVLSRILDVDEELELAGILGVDVEELAALGAFVGWRPPEVGARQQRYCTEVGSGHVEQRPGEHELQQIRMIDEIAARENRCCGARSARKALDVVTLEPNSGQASWGG